MLLELWSIFPRKLSHSSVRDYEKGFHVTSTSLMWLGKVYHYRVTKNINI